MKIMKTSIRTIILAAAAVFAAMSCQKEVAGKQELVKEGETIQVSINAGLGGFVAADATKSTATPVVRLTWEDADEVDAYCGTQKLNTNPITVTPSENRMFAKLSGEISSTGLTSGTSVITFVYSNLDPSKVSGLTFDFSSQDGTIPFVAYATLAYDGATTLTDKMVEFKFATSVMKIAATNLGGGDITNATISGINTKVTLTPQTNIETVDITGSEEGTVTKSAGFDASSDGTRAIFTVGLVPEDANSNRKLTINGKKADLTSSAIAAGKSYTTPCTFEETEFVVIGGKKWAKKNLGASDINAFGELYSWGEVATKFDYSSGNYDSSAKAISKNLTKADGNDVANAVKGGKWRMPTKDDFIALDIACGGTGEWQEINTIITSHIDNGKVKKGKYWLDASQTVLSGINELKDITAAGMLYSDGENYLFFPAAGYSSGPSRSMGGSSGFYWSSTLNNSSYAYRLDFSEGDFCPQQASSRFWGLSVRPVSD